MFFYHFSFLVVFLDIIQLLSLNNEYGPKVVAEKELDDQEYTKYMDSIKKWMPSVSNYMESLKNEKLGPNRLIMSGKNDKLTPLSAILSSDDSSKAESRRQRKRAISTELLEIEKELMNAAGEQVSENYPETSNVAVPDGVAEGLAEFAEFEEYIESANKAKSNS